MNELGTWLRVARFISKWQIISVYLLYLVPLALYVRGFSWFQQYLYSLFFIALLEFAGYSLKTSFIYENNLVDKAFTRSNFSLFMVLFFSLYIPFANRALLKLRYFTR